jgi:two-component system chemotaxis response regulator CheB
VSARDNLDGRHDLVVIGASAGGVEALRRVVAALPADLEAAVCVVLHIAPGSASALAGILERAGDLPCRRAEDGAPLRPGEILVAPPDHHLAVEEDRVRLTVGPRENNHRPSVDVLFRTAAAARGKRVVGVILSGMRDDGAAGLAVIQARGGATVVQAPSDALYPEMPMSALEMIDVDAVVTAAEMGQTIAAIVRGENLPAEASGSRAPDDPEQGERLTSVCPECGGVLTEQTEAGAQQWECHVGHRYSPASLLHAQAARVEAALWTAVRALRDRAALLDRMAEGAEGRGRPAATARFRQQAQDAREQAETVRSALLAAAATTLGDVENGEHVESPETADPS